jgi:hypothetical protein
MSLPPAVWDDIFSLEPQFEPPQWEVLLLDARAALPEISAAVVLSATALEVFITSILDRLAAKRGVSAALWNWINDRGFFLKEPSTEEQFDFLLKELCGHSLKEDAELWGAFKAIRRARNTFVHGGVPLGSQGQITLNETTQLVINAQKIVAFVKSHLPDDLKWPTFQYKFETKIIQQIMRAGAQPSSPAPAVANTEKATPQLSDAGSTWRWLPKSSIPWLAPALLAIGIAFGFLLGKIVP